PARGIAQRTLSVISARSPAGSWLSVSGRPRTAAGRPSPPRQSSPLLTWLPPLLPRPVTSAASPPRAARAARLPRYRGTPDDISRGAPGPPRATGSGLATSGGCGAAPDRPRGDRLSRP